MIFVLLFCLLIAFLPLIYIYYFVLSGPPYVPISDTALETFLKHSRNIKGKRTLDIGSGDGKVVLAFAKRGAEANGVELNPLLVLISKYRLRKEKHANVYLADFWQFDTSSFDVITMFGISHIMGRLEKKLQKEVKPGAVILVNRMLFPTWKPIKKVGSVYVYKK